MDGLTNTEQTEKEARMFDKAINSLCQMYQEKACFDGFTVKPMRVPCVPERGNDFYTDHGIINRFLKAPFRQVFSKIIHKL